MQACMQGYITYEGGGGGATVQKRTGAGARPANAFGETARDSPGASLHMCRLMGKTRQIIVGRPTVHYNQNLKLLTKKLFDTFASGNLI